jgi:hypothetical protein
MALVRRTPAVGRAQVPGSLPVQPIPPQGIPQQGIQQPGGAVPGPEQAAAVPSPPAKAWATVAGLGIAGVGALGAWDINTFATPTTFHVDNQMTVFVALLVFAGAVERILEPFTRFLPGRREQELYEKAVADMENGVPGAMNAAAHYKAALDSARASRAILAWGIATFAATLLSAAAGFYLLRLISADQGWHGVPAWADALVTGLIVGSGTKPLHDLVTRAQSMRS